MTGSTPRFVKTGIEAATQAKAEAPVAKRAVANSVSTETAAAEWQPVEAKVTGKVSPETNDQDAETIDCGGQIAAENGITEGAIRKRPKAQEWTRDLNSRIKAKADDLVRKRQVRSEVRTELAASERTVIEANAEAIARVQLGHCEDIQRAGALMLKLLAEPEDSTDGPELAELKQRLLDALRGVPLAHPGSGDFH